MSPEAWSAVFAAAGVIVTGIVFLSTRRATKEKERADKLEEVQAEAEEHTNTQLSRITEKLDTMDADYQDRFDKGREALLKIQSDIADLKATTAVHEDRWQRPYLSAVPGERR